MKNQRKPFQDYKSIYELAAGREGDGHILLSPNRAIFSALCSVLSIHDEERQIELMGQEAYEYANVVGVEFDNKNIPYFVNVFAEACSEPITFERWVPQKQFDYMERELFGTGYMPRDHYKTRLVAAKTRRAYFPATEEFIKAHEREADIHSLIWTGVIEGLTNPKLHA